MNISIAIPVQNEIYLERTVARIKATCKDLPELVLVFDGDDPRRYAIDYPEHLLKTVVHDEPMGTGPSRHSAMLAATKDVVHCTDAHVDWEDGSDWADRLVKISDKYPNDVLCCVMKSMNKDTLVMNVDDAKYTGAAIAPRVFDACGHNVISAKWKVQEAGIIQVVMGAAYTIRRDRYNEIGQPWRVNQGWGHDEETISIVNWIHGGNSRLTDVVSGHISGVPKNRKTTDDICGLSLWANRLSSIYYLPMSEGLRESLLAWAMHDENLSAKRDDVEAIIKKGVVSELNESMLRTGRTLDDFIKEFGCDDCIEIPKPSKARDVFNEIYKKRVWGDGETVSGSGSTKSAAAIISLEIPKLIERYGFKTMLDIACGDFNWLSEVDLSGIKYIGADVVRNLIQKNKAKYPDMKWVRLDMITNRLPKVDVVLCRDAFPHLPTPECELAIENMRNSGVKWLLTTSFPNLKTNANVRMGQWRPVNLGAHPFNLKEVEVINEGLTGRYSDKSLCLYDLR